MSYYTIQSIRGNWLHKLTLLSLMQKNWFRNGVWNCMRSYFALSYLFFVFSSTFFALLLSSPLFYSCLCSNSLAIVCVVSKTSEQLAELSTCRRFVYSVVWFGSFAHPFLAVPNNTDRVINRNICRDFPQKNKWWFNWSKSSYHCTIHRHRTTEYIHIKSNHSATVNTLIQSRDCSAVLFLFYFISDATNVWRHLFTINTMALIHSLYTVLDAIAS